MTIFPGSAFRWFRFDAFTKPRRPRHPLLRALMGAAGLTLLLVLLVFGVFVGAAMLLGGMLWKAWTQRRTPRAAHPHASNPHATTIDGSFRVVGKPGLPLAR